MSHLDSLRYIVTNSEKSLILEATLIKNIVQGIMCSLRMIRDILMSKLQMKYPRLIITRNITKKTEYITSPFTDVTSVKKL